jgi:hypothetical protein
VEILDGVTVDDVVIVDGTMNVHDGSSVVTRDASAPKVAT